MAKKILTNASIVVNAVNLSDHASSVEINSEKEEVDVTSFGASSREILLGLGEGTITVSFFQDFEAASVDATLWPIHNNSTAVVIVVKPDAGAVSATNPSYTMTGVLPTYTPIAGAVGEASTVDIEFRNSSQSGIVRAIA